MLTTALDTLHRELGARMVAFAGYEMPVQYPSGIIREHLHTRAAAGLFDVSHMGQVVIRGKQVDRALEALVPVDLLGLPAHSQTYALFTNEQGGVLDDLIITRWADDCFFLVVNAGGKAEDLNHLRSHLAGYDVELRAEQALLALQGPSARAVMAEMVPDAAQLTFMHGCKGLVDGVDVYVTCSGYTGEDGFEISVSNDHAEDLARRLLENESVAAIGLGARDSLRLEAGLCLYGHELDASTGPVEAGLMWSVSKPRRADGERPGGFPGAEVIFQQQQRGAGKKRVGLRVNGKRPVREGQAVMDADGSVLGIVTSACYGATAGAPLAMAYVDPECAVLERELFVDVRGKPLSVTVTKQPFVPQRYFRG